MTVHRAAATPPPAPPAAAEMETLVRRYAGLIASAIRRVCGGARRHLQPDVEQDVYLALWKRLQTGKSIDHPASYLYKVALTTALASVRRQPREQSLGRGDEEVDWRTVKEISRRQLQSME